MSITQTVISGDSLQRLIALILCCSCGSTRYLTIKGHDWTESVTFWDESELARCLLVVLTKGLHLLFLD